MPPTVTRWLQWWRPRYWLLVLCALNAVISYADRTNISIAIIPMAEEFKWSQSTSGFVLSAFYYGYLCTQLIGGWLSYRHGGKIVLAISCALWSIFTVLTPLCARLSFSLLITCRILLGLAEGMGYPAIMAMIAVHIPSQEHSRAIGFVLSGSYVGAVIANLASAQLIEKNVFGGWPAVFWVFGVTGMVWLVPWILYSAPSLSSTMLPVSGGKKFYRPVPSPPVQLQDDDFPGDNDDDNYDEADNNNNNNNRNNNNGGKTIESVMLGETSSSSSSSLAATYQRVPGSKIRESSKQLDAAPAFTAGAVEYVNIDPTAVIAAGSVTITSPLSVESSSGSNGDHAVPWRRLFQTRQLWAIIITQFCQSWSYWLFLNWMPTYYKDKFGADIEQIGYFAIVPYVVQGITGNLTGLLSDLLIYRYRYSVLTVRRFMQCTGMLLMALFTMLAAVAVSSITEGMICLTLAMGVFNMTLAGVSVNHLDIAPRYASVVYGIGNTAAQIPGIIGVWFTGVLLDMTNGNWTVVFGLAASLSVIGAICWLFMVGTRPVVN